MKCMFTLQIVNSHRQTVQYTMFCNTLLYNNLDQMEYFTDQNSLLVIDTKFI